MKMTYETSVNASMESIWKVLMDVAHYSEWNTLIPIMEGTPGPEASLNVTLNPMGLNRRKVVAKMSGFFVPKYFSFEDHSHWGRWFLQEEIVVRMKERGEATQLIGEIFMSGLSLRFRRSSVESGYKRSLVRMIDGLKDRVERGEIEGG